MARACASNLVTPVLASDILAAYAIGKGSDLKGIEQSFAFAEVEAKEVSAAVGDSSMRLERPRLTPRA